MSTKLCPKMCFLSALWHLKNPALPICLPLFSVSESSISKKRLTSTRMFKCFQCLVQYRFHLQGRFNHKRVRLLRSVVSAYIGIDSFNRFLFFSHDQPNEVSGEVFKLRIRFAGVNYFSIAIILCEAILMPKVYFFYQIWSLGPRTS